MLLTAKEKRWMRERIRPEEIDRYLVKGDDFINDGRIIHLLEQQRPGDASRIRDILQKSLAVQTLSPEETARLLNVTDPDLLTEMQAAAAAVKRKVYDNRIVTFAPLYTGNLCVNNCRYCGFRRENRQIQRRVLTREEIRQETEVLAGQIGHKRLITVYGEHPATDIDYIIGSLSTIYGVAVPTRRGTGQIRRVNVNAAPLPVEELQQLKRAGIGTYQVFQETYHHKTYQAVHPADTIKGHYRWRLYAMHRAMEAGVDDVGLGVLFGLYDWKFEVLGLVYHAHELERAYGIGPHTISFPRLEPACNTPFVQNTRHAVSDADFQKLITVIRLAVPYTGMIITARETAAVRRACLPLGCTQTDASSRIGIGAYYDQPKGQAGKRQQFLLGDTRSLDEVVRELAETGYITSFCTAGYRCGRTGKKIMDLLRSGTEGKYCKLNAILTFREWLDDFAGEETQEAGEAIISREIREVRKKLPRLYPLFAKYYRKIKQGQRDLYV